MNKLVAFAGVVLPCGFGFLLWDPFNLDHKPTPVAVQASLGPPPSLVDPKSVTQGKPKEPPKRTIANTELYKLAVEANAQKTAKDRMAGLSALLQSCELEDDVTIWAIAGGAKTDQESRALRQREIAGREACAVQSVASSFQRATDSDQLDPRETLKAALTLKDLSTGSLERNVRHTSYGEIMKDPDSVRGYFARVTGDVIQIRRDGPVYEGLMSTGNTGVVYFVAVGKADGVVEGSTTTFAGLFRKIYRYPTRIGGSNEAPVVIGRFANQDDETETVLVGAAKDAKCCSGHRGLCGGVEGNAYCCDGTLASDKCSAN